MKPRVLLYLAVGTGLAWGETPPEAPARPFTAQDRWNHYLHRTFSLERMALLGVDTGIERLLDTSQDWHPGTRGFLHRYSSGFGGRLVRNSIEFGAGWALREDTRFRASHKKGLAARIVYAASGSVLAGKPDGEREFSYARLAATTGGTLISTVWRPCHNNPRHYVEEVANGYLGHLQNSLLTEFSPDLLRFGKKVGRAIWPGSKR